MFYTVLNNSDKGHKVFFLTRTPFKSPNVYFPIVVVYSSSKITGPNIMCPLYYSEVQKSVHACISTLSFF